MASASNGSEKRLLPDELLRAAIWMESLYIDKIRRECVIEASQCYIPAPVPTRYGAGEIRVYGWTEFQVGGILRAGCLGGGFTFFYALRRVPEPFGEQIIRLGADRLEPPLRALLVDEHLIRIQIDTLQPERQLELDFHEAEINVLFDISQEQE